MEDKLLYELEYKVNELRKAQLSAIEYENMSVRDLLDLGFDNCFIRLNNNGNKQWFNLGYKDIDRKDNNKVYYESNDFGELTEKQLNCMVKYVSEEISDYNYQQVYVELVNEKENIYFLGEE